MTRTSVRTFFRRAVTGSRRSAHPEAVADRLLDLPVRVDDPATASRLALDLCRNRREEMTLALLLDDRHRLVGHVVLATCWAQAARLSARPSLLTAGSSRASALVLVRYRHHGDCKAGLAERRSAGSIGAACVRSGLTLLDHVVVVGTGEYASAFGDRL
jgi:DNA repair protein RadC